MFKVMDTEFFFFYSLVIMLFPQIRGVIYQSRVRVDMCIQYIVCLVCDLLLSSCV